MLDQMGIFTSRHADHVEKRAGARDGAMPSWISTWFQENPAFGAGNPIAISKFRCRWECGKSFARELGKFHICVFQKISSEIFLM